MDETSLRAQFERAVSERPPTPHLVPNALRAGLRLRKHRRIEAATASFAAVALTAVVIPAASGWLGALAHRPPRTTARTGATAYVWVQPNTVIPIRLSTGTALRPMRFRGLIEGIAAAPDGRAVFVFSYGSAGSRVGHPTAINFVTRINTMTGTAGKPIRLTGGPQQRTQFRIAPDGKVAYSIEYGWPNSRYLSLALVAINLRTGAERKLVNTGSGPYAITPDGRTAYVASIGAGLVPVDLATRTVLRPVKVPGGPATDVAIAPDGRTAYAVSITTSGPIRASRFVTWVTPVSTRTNIPAKPIAAQQGRQGHLSRDVAITPDGRTAFVFGGNVSPIDLATGKVLKPLTNLSGDLVISPDSRIAYATWTNWLVPIDVRASTALGRIFMPAGFTVAADPAFAPDGKVAYVGAVEPRQHRPAVGLVIPIDTVTQRAGKAVQVAGTPQQIVVVP